MPRESADKMMNYKVELVLWRKRMEHQLLQTGFVGRFVDAGIFDLLWRRIPETIAE